MEMSFMGHKSYAGLTLLILNSACSEKLPEVFWPCMIWCVVTTRPLADNWKLEGNNTLRLIFCFQWLRDWVSGITLTAFASQISRALCVWLVVWHSAKSRVAVKPQPSGPSRSLKQTWYPTDQLHQNVHLFASFVQYKQQLCSHITDIKWSSWCEETGLLVSKVVAFVAWQKAAQFYRSKLGHHSARNVWLFPRESRS